MYLGSRKIRSAGRTSGSIEITLPVKLQNLLGVSCNIELRDGLRPEIVLQPNFGDVQSAMRLVWSKLSISLRETGEIGEFKLGDFTVSVFPHQYWKDRPPLSYADALQTLESWRAKEDCRHEGFSRLLAFMAVRAGVLLGLKGELSLAFGDAIAFLVTGRTSGMGTDFERGMAYRLFGEEGHRRIQDVDLLDDTIWIDMAEGFRQVFDQFFLWQDALEVYEEDRNNWYRALSFEMESPAPEVV